MPVAVVAGLVVGAVRSLLGVAGGELISTPIVITGIVRHWLAGRFRSRTMLSYLVLPMSSGSPVGALAGSYLAVWMPTDALRIVLALILAVSAVKLFRKGP